VATARLELILEGKMSYSAYLLPRKRFAQDDRVVCNLYLPIPSPHHIHYIRDVLRAPPRLHVARRGRYGWNVRLS